MTCDCEMWRKLDRLREVAAGLVEAGFADTEDEDDIVVWLTRRAERWGYLPRTSGDKARSMARWEEQRRVVLEYARYAKTTNVPAQRAAKIRSLGVSPETMTRWARKHFGPGFLARARPTPTLRLVIETLCRAPRLMTRQEILRETGVTKGSLSGALHWGLRSKRLQRAKNKEGQWTYAVDLRWSRHI